MRSLVGGHHDGEDGHDDQEDDGVLHFRVWWEFAFDWEGNA